MTERLQPPTKVFPLKSQVAEVMTNLNEIVSPDEFQLRSEKLPLHDLHHAAHCFRMAAHIAFKDQPASINKTESYSRNTNWLITRPAEALLNLAIIRSGLAEAHNFYSQKYKLSGSVLLHENPDGQTQLIALHIVPQFIAQAIRLEGLLPEQKRELYLAMYLLDQQNPLDPIAGANLITLAYDAHWTKKNLYESKLSWTDNSRGEARNYLTEWMNARSDMNNGNYPPISSITPDLCRLCQFHNDCNDRPITTEQVAGQLTLDSAVPKHLN